MTGTRLSVIVRCLVVSAASASLVACGSGSNNTVITPPYGLPAFSGNYVFSVTGTDPSDGDYAALGRFFADGKGNITGAVADYNLGSGIDDDVPLTGTYTVANGTVTVNLTDGNAINDSFTTSIVSSGSAKIQGFDGNGSGTLYAQSASGFSPAGSYAINITGEGDGAVSGNGDFVAGSAGTFTSGDLTYTDTQTSISYPAISGFIGAAETSGRGQAAIEGTNLVYYVISPTQIQMINLDERALLSIPATKQ